MTEIERIADTYAKRWARALGADFVPASFVDEIAELLITHSRPPAGFVRDEKGKDHPRNVVGTTTVVMGERCGAVFDHIEMPHISLPVDLDQAAAEKERGQ